jgi:hypothetical protein
MSDSGVLEDKYMQYIDLEPFEKYVQKRKLVDNKHLP